jgi:hypothetical protein
MTFQKRCYLGFLGLIGVYELPKLIGVFQADGSWWDLTGALWFLWFFYFVPEAKADTSDDQS